MYISVQLLVQVFQLMVDGRTVMKIVGEMGRPLDIWTQMALISIQRLWLYRSCYGRRCWYRFSRYVGDYIERGNDLRVCDLLDQRMWHGTSYCFSSSVNGYHNFLQDFVVLYRLIATLDAGFLQRWNYGSIYIYIYTRVSLNSLFLADNGPF